MDQRVPHRNILAALSWLFVFSVSFSAFAFNAFGTVSALSFQDWGRDSDQLVLNRVAADGSHLFAGTFGLVVDLAKGVPYASNFGLQGWLWTWVQNGLGFVHSEGGLRLLSAALTAGSLATLSLVLAKLTRPAFASLFVLSMIGSPWVVQGGHSLYWAMFTWFLPICAAGWFVLARNRISREAAFATTVLLFAVRFACGYEFISTFALAAAIMPILAYWFRPEATTTRRAWFQSGLLIIASVVGFVLAFIPHAVMRGSGNLFNGIRAVVTEDVLRRTYGNPADFDPIYAASLRANPLRVLETYIFGFPTDFESVGYGSPFTFTFGPHSLLVLILSALGLVLWLAMLGEARWKRDLLAVIFALVIPVSWFVLGKSHSYIHTHIDYVLWYLFVPSVLIWLIISATGTIWRGFRAGLKSSPDATRSQS